MEESVIAFFVSIMTAKDVLDVFNRKLLGRRDGVREVVRILDFFAGEIFPSGLRAVFDPVCISSCVCLIGFAEVEVAVVAFFFRFVGAHLDCMFDKVGRGDDVRSVYVNRAEGVGVGDIQHFVVADLLGKISASADKI